jgi:predicted enzyme related to lactoylglutathione lyase
LLHRMGIVDGSVSWLFDLLILLYSFSQTDLSMQLLLNWFEIPVKDFYRSMKFYAQVFRHIRFEIVEFNGISQAIFRPLDGNNKFLMTGALVEYPDRSDERNGPILFFTIHEDMREVLNRVEKFGGTVIQGKELIRNKMDDGRFVIPKTLIDGNVGYFSYFKDTEGNQIGLYTNS